ncbi:hypothetical protein Tco_0934300 [Tanacetum coccineum]
MLMFVHSLSYDQKYWKHHKREKCEHAEGTNDQEEQGNEKPELSKDANVQGEHVAEKINTNNAEEVSTLKGTMVIHSSEVKGSEEKSSDDEPSAKRPKVRIPTPTPLRSILPDLLRDVTPPRDPRKGKEIADEGEKMKQLVSLMDQVDQIPIC